MTETERPAPRRWSFPIGRIAGIQIRVHATFLLLVALFALAGTAPGGPGVVASLVWLVAIFACVLVHEFAHCLVGRRHGLVVHEIDLLPIGGVSRLESFPETPRDEFTMAIAGPAASLGLGFGFAAAAVALSQSVFPIDFVHGAFLARLAWLNVLLAAFNMLPAFPLDGGRVFRALLELRYDLERATRIAGNTGRWLAFALIAVGILINPWLAVIGVFVYLGANAEENATVAHLRLAGRQVRDLMLVYPTTVDARVDAAALRLLARRNPQGTFPVMRNGHYLGVVDVAAIERAGPAASAGELADTTAVTVRPDDDVEDDLAVVVGDRRHAVPVVDHGRVVGLLRLDEISRVVSGPDPGSPTTA